MDKPKELFLKQIESTHQINKIRGSQDYMNYIGNGYEFLINLVHDQDTEIALLRSDIQIRSWNQLHDVATKVSSDAKIYALEKQAEKYERTIEQLRNENKILIRTIEILTGSKPYFAVEREAIATREK